MAKAFLFNPSSEAITVSVNNGHSFEIPAANTSNGSPSAIREPITVVNNSNPAPGQISLGANQVALSSMASGEFFNFTLNIPMDMRFESLQLYFFWDNSHSYAWVATLDGRYSSEASGSSNR